MTPAPDPAGAHERARRALLACQRPTGAWEGEVVWCSLLGAQYALTHAVLGVPLDERTRSGLLRDFRRAQLASGGWGLHPCSEPYLFTTALVYVAARFLGEDAEEPMVRRARRWITAQGGVLAIPTWGKLWLALLGLYRWEGVRPILPEAWALPRWLPLYPGNFYCHTRLIYAAMAAIYASRYQHPTSPLTEALRTELYPQPFPTIAFDRAAGRLRAEELAVRPSWFLRALFGVAAVAERWHRPARRAALVKGLLETIRYDFRQTGHGGLSPVSGLLGLIALWIHDPDDPDVPRALHGLRHWVWEDQEGLRVAGAGSVAWDTALAIQALEDDHPASPGVPHPASEALERGRSFLAHQQLRDDDPALEVHDRSPTRGGFCFSARWHGWPVSDCTAEALLALLGEPSPHPLPDAARFVEAVRFILARQNPDGGFGSYESRRTRWPLEWLNPSELFGACMTERSYVECTASALQALAAFRRRFPSLLVDECAASMARAVRFLRGRQERDGYWRGAWGVHCIYGTLFGVRGLVASPTAAGSSSVTRACRWLVAAQRGDGGWGEDHSGCRTGRYVPATDSQPIQTAWALMALLEARWPDWTPIERGVRWLVAAQRADGTWPEQTPAGVFFQSALLDYTLYGQVFPVWALGLYQRRRAAWPGAFARGAEVVSRSDAGSVRGPGERKTIMPSSPGRSTWA